MVCKRVYAHGDWIPIDMYVSDHSDAIVSHSVCPDCKEKHYPKLSKDR
jgi:hypothetical protein